MAPQRTRRNRRRNGRAGNTKLVVLTAEDGQKCMLCGHRDVDETLYGPMYMLNDVVVHYYCILLSSSAMQNGTDKQGILGFLMRDIKNELKRGSAIRCYHCKQPCATIACCHPRCGKVFHLPCGRQNGSLHQFYGSFQSFCWQHRPVQIVDEAVLKDRSPTECAICMDDIVPAPLPDTLWAPCCRNNNWLHRKCVQSMALNAGYLFKCPLCNDSKKFKFKMLELGIYIPSRDAAWEFVPGAFSELMERPSTCAVSVCLCPLPGGRDVNEDYGEWSIVPCYTCGASGTHQRCGSIELYDDVWNCESCLLILTNAKRTEIESSNHRESVPSTSGMTHGEPIETISEMTNEDPVPSTSVMIEVEQVPLTSVMIKEEQVLSTSVMIKEEQVSSTNGMSNFELTASTSGLLTNSITTQVYELNDSPSETPTPRAYNWSSNSEIIVIEENSDLNLNFYNNSTHSQTLSRSTYNRAACFLNDNRTTLFRSSTNGARCSNTHSIIDSIIISDSSDNDDDLSIVSVSSSRTSSNGLPVIQSAFTLNRPYLYSNDEHRTIGTMDLTLDED